MTRTIDLGRFACAVGFGFVALVATATTPKADEARLWHLVEQLAQATGGGLDAVIEAWPKQDLTARDEGALGFDGGTFGVSGPLQVGQSDVRVNGAGELVLVSLDLAGACVTRATLKKHYPDAETFAWPQPDNQNPYSYEQVSLEGVQVSFGFPEHGPQCLFKIVFKPVTPKTA